MFLLCYRNRLHDDLSLGDLQHPDVMHKSGSFNYLSSVTCIFYSILVM